MNTNFLELSEEVPFAYANTITLGSYNYSYLKLSKTKTYQYFPSDILKEALPHIYQVFVI